MASLLIVYHSQSGSSARLARAAWQGATLEVGVEVGVRRAWDAGTVMENQVDLVETVHTRKQGRCVKG